jgi:hypothetical protein
MDHSSAGQRASLGRLPFELLCNICDYVNLVHKPSVLTFALVNHTFHAAATASLFHTIKIEARGLVQLEKKVEEWVNILSCRGFHHVRRLVINGWMLRDS